MHSLEMLTILRSDGTVAKGQQVPPITQSDMVRLYRLMVFNRMLDERMIMLQRQGRIGFYIGSIGEEASILGSAFALRDTDWIVPCYREVGAALLRGFSLFELMCQLFGNAQDPLKGRQMPNHYAIKELRYTSVSSPVGTQIPHATGMALAAKIRGNDEVVLVYFGDGATSQGDFHVAANFAGVFKTPTVFLCRNNQWAISVPREMQTASKTLAIKAKAYGFEGVRIDGNDLFAVYTATHEAVEKARRGDGPTFIEAVTYRQGAHSTSDDPRVYRDESEVEEWRQKDPIIRLKTYLIGLEYWSEEQDAGLQQEIKDEIQATLRKVEEIGPPDIEAMFEDVYDHVPWHLKEQMEMVLEEAAMRS